MKINRLLSLIRILSERKKVTMPELEKRLFSSAEIVNALVSGGLLLSSGLWLGIRMFSTIACPKSLGCLSVKGDWSLFIKKMPAISIPVGCRYCE